MSKLPLPVGTKIVAMRKIGSVEEGSPGIITAVVGVPFFFWTRQMYLCTFAGNNRVAARPVEIDDFDHDHDLTELENPDFKLDWSRVWNKHVSN